MPIKKHIRRWINQLRVWNKLSRNRNARYWENANRLPDDILEYADAKSRRGLPKIIFGPPTPEGGRYVIASEEKSTRDMRRRELSVFRRSKSMLSGLNSTPEWQHEIRRKAHERGNDPENNNQRIQRRRRAAALRERRNAERADRAYLRARAARLKAQREEKE